MAGYAEHDGLLPGSTPAPAPPEPARDEPDGGHPRRPVVDPDLHRRPSRRALPRPGSPPPASARSRSLRTAEPGRRVHVAGLVTHRQRPGTASGITFLNVEDETGMLNVVCSPGVMKSSRPAARNKVAVVVRGIVEREDGVTNLVADRVVSLDTVLPGTGAALQARQSSRDFR
ncbi:OB-fold nucleic acid binding domain-containing protein [Nocardioides convexus]|uniref:OB-fold nucleic acid binding domain-containing protein n=1 Tax=Nocardioides convexus TaxID=2712224 RepID=UPI0031014665